ncbi:hypothetical protein O8B39_08370 [Agrobacterium rhizogenes]|uniref:hypothetical protein n=1 Tax=Agrobacterium sp. LMR679 TaxID=3014335 RepID=UPI0022AFB057|nr:hypothetical protein [Agrobacterium sp. LMR679]MCZ4074947.1 hypothetical protein [Agrobacterium sp. LMR679]MCZ7494508.1 hypothetical protein [Rhizobium rhizogenes]
MTEAIDRIEGIRREHLDQNAKSWAGLERLLIMELVRSLDEAAFAFKIAPNGSELLEKDSVRNLMMLGASTALAASLSLIRNAPGNVPWVRSDPSLAALADRHLLECGKLSVIHRLATLERYGLAKTSFPSPDKLVIEVEDDGAESTERAEGRWLSNQQRLRLQAIEQSMVARKNDIGERIGRYVTAVEGWSIAYDADPDTVGYHRDLAEMYSAGTAELDSLPPMSQISGRAFDEWNRVSMDAYGKVLHHIACGTKLMSQFPHLDLRNLLTAFARRDDIEESWGGGDQGRQILNLLTLDAEGAQRLDAHHEIPIPYYIDFGRDFVLLPIFGALMNPVAGLTNQLRHLHRRDWDRALNAREAVFRSDLAKLLEADRYVVLDRGCNLRKSDGSILTDVDTAVIDRETGELCLVQLKWPDIYGRSLAERESRRSNLAKANDWVGRVHDWIAGRTSDEVCKALHLPQCGDRPVSLLVLSRHVADFVDAKDFDRRAIWTSWPRLAKTVSESSGEGFLKALALRTATIIPRRPNIALNMYRLPGLTVEVRVN